MEFFFKLLNQCLPHFLFPCVNPDLQIFDFDADVLCYLLHLEVLDIQRA